MPPRRPLLDQGLHAHTGEQYPSDPLGNDTLPIARYREEIEYAIQHHPFVITESPTGSGKSTQIPQYLLQLGAFTSIDHSQPRILAAQEVAKRIGYEISQKWGPTGELLVACKTSEDTDDRDAPITVMTDGVMTNRAIGGYYDQGPVALIGDEVHERKIDQELNLALFRHIAAINPEARIVISSATLDTAALSDYFRDPYTHEAAPVLKLEGSPYEVKEATWDDAWDASFYYGSLGKDVLMFVEGKAAIDRTVSELHRRFNRVRARTNNAVPGPVILPLHADMPVSRQELALQQYEHGKIIVATNIAQTSITIPGLDVVVDTQKERHIEAYGDLSILRTGPISASSSIQRRGRVGRERDGLYVRAPIPELHGELSEGPIETYDVAEIKRAPLEGLALKMAHAAGRIATHDFLDTPDEALYNRAQQRLARIGAITLRGEATAIGLRMNEAPLDPQYARMVAEAERALSVCKTEVEREYALRVLAQTVALTAAQQTRGIIGRTPEHGTGWQSYTKEYSSDAIQELEVFATIYAGKLQTRTEDQLEQIGILTRRYNKARLLYEETCERLQINPSLLCQPDHDQRRELLRHYITGTSENIFVYNELDNTYMQSGITGFHLPRESAVRHGRDRLIVGHAIGIEQTRLGSAPRVNLRIVGATPVGPGDLFRADHHTQRIELKHVAYELADDGSVLSRQRTYYDGTDIGHEVLQKPTTDQVGEIREFLIEQAFEVRPETGKPYNPHIESIMSQLDDLQSRVKYPLRIEQIKDKLKQKLREKLPNYMANMSLYGETWEQLDITDAIKQAEIDRIYDAKPDIIHTYSEDESGEFSEYRLEYHGGQAHVTVTPAQAHIVRDRLFELGFGEDDFVLKLIDTRDKKRQSWSKARRGGEKPGRSFDAAHLQRRDHRRQKR